MKRKFLSLLAPIILVLGAAAPAVATDTFPSSVLSNFLCNAELNVLDQSVLLDTDPFGAGYTGGLVVSIFPPVTGGTTERHCTGSESLQNVQILCEKILEDLFSTTWPIDTVINATGFECRVSRKDCPGDGPEGITNTSSLRIESLGGEDGFLRMQCNLN